MVTSPRVECDSCGDVMEKPYGPWHFVPPEDNPEDWMHMVKCGNQVVVTAR